MLPLEFDFYLTDEHYALLDDFQIKHTANGKRAIKRIRQGAVIMFVFFTSMMLLLVPFDHWDIKMAFIILLFAWMFWKLTRQSRRQGTIRRKKLSEAFPKDYFGPFHVIVDEFGITEQTLNYHTSCSYEMMTNYYEDESMVYLECLPKGFFISFRNMQLKGIWKSFVGY